MDQYQQDGSNNQPDNMHPLKAQPDVENKNHNEFGNSQTGITSGELQQNGISQNETPQYNEPQNMNYQNSMNSNGMNQNDIYRNNMQYNGYPPYGMPQNNMPNNMQNNIPPYGYPPKRNIVQYNPEISDFNQLRMSPRKIISWAGLSLSILAAVVIGVQTLIEILVSRLRPELADTDWYIWVVTLISLVIIGLPVYFLFINRIPDSPRGEEVKLKPTRFIAIFLICYALMYVTNIFSIVLTYMISIIKGDEVINPVMEAIYGGNYIITLLYAAVVAPIVEELIFRKLLLSKLRRFGDIPAILFSGLAFGLFHFNLSQLFYAAMLGFVFAYVTIRTNRIRYAIILHMLVNGISTAISPLVMSGNLIVMGIIGLCVLTFVTLGVIFLIISIKKIKLEKTYPVIKASSYFLNFGTILYIGISLVIIVIQTLFA